MTDATPQRTTRRPTGRVSWPFINIAGKDKAGKTWSALQASASDLVGKTYVIPVGEDDFDEYGAIPGANFEIVENDGTYADIYEALRWATEQPRDEQGRPNLIIFDSGTELWDLLKDEQGIIARRRAMEKAAKGRRSAPRPDDEVTITSDQWNTAKERWMRVVVALRNHQGPAIMTTRLEYVTLFDSSGQPTRDKDWKVQAEKNLGFAVTGTVQLRDYRKAVLVGMRSVALQTEPDEIRRLPNFTFDGLWRAMGLENTANIEARRVNVTNAAAGADQLEAEANLSPDDPARYGNQAGQRPSGPQPPTAEQFQADTTAIWQQHATDSIARVKALQDYGRHYTAEVLARVQVPANGGMHDAATVLRGLIERAQQDARAHANSVGMMNSAAKVPSGRAQGLTTAPVPEVPDGDFAQGDAHAQETPRAQQPARTRDEKVAAARAQLEQAEATARAQSPTTNRALERLMDEVKGHAEVFGFDARDYVADLVGKHGVEYLRDVPFQAARKWVFEQRPAVVRALVEQGNATAAEHLDAAHKKNEIGLWIDLTGARAQVPDEPMRTEPVPPSTRAQESEPERAPEPAQAAAARPRF
ncbi:hypothetical protein ACFCZ3_20365 [Cellulosimicrobium cellulans]|uniref:hypothetical protein n=1 Tax=Cellulosimicrobium cellulans TaxID=1710 RepID=UPI0035DAD0F6